MRHTLRLVVVALMLLAPRAAGAAPAAPAEPASAATEAKAREHLLAGNRHFASDDFMRAVEQYKAALALWDQPMIRFNLAVALIELDRSREAFEHLEAALRVPEVLGERAAEARNYLRLVRARLSTVSVACPPAAVCEIDGQRASAGAAQLVLEPGAHTLAARQAGYESLTETLVLEAGGHRDVAVVLRRPRARAVRRWAGWKPWSVVAIGVAVAGAGAGAYVVGRGRVDDAQAELGARCAAGCPLGFPMDLSERADAGHRLQQVGLGAAIGGAALIVAGAALVLMNQPRVELGAVAARAERRPALAVAAVPGGAIAALGGVW